MGRFLGLVIVLSCGAACIRGELIACEDGRLCPSGTECDVVHQTCVRPEQRDACDALADGDVCSAGDIPGICDQGTCVPGCGDGVHGAGEECDDGNFRSHDGCSSACLAETVSWHTWEPAWTGRTTHGAAYHVAAQQLVIIGGANGQSIREDAWYRTPAGVWTQHVTPGPARRRSPAIAYDPSRAKLVLFGGADAADADYSDTWEYDGTTWTQVTPTVSPAARRGAGMVYDVGRQRLVLFGGRTAAAAFNDTWEYDGTTWTRITTTTAPTGRSHVGIAYDSARQCIVIFGGGALGVGSDTWELGLTGGWVRTATTGPLGRLGAAMTYFPDRGATVMFGGQLSSNQRGTDTWEYVDATTGWVQIPGGPTTPPARAFATLTFDPSDTRLRLIGGNDATAHDDVWEYLDDGTWASRTPQFSPPPRFAPLVHDRATDQLLLLGGVSSGLAMQVWAFDSIRWRQVSPVTLPLRYSHAGTYDIARQRAIVFGGYGLDFIVHDDTSEFDAVTQTWSAFGGSKPPRRIGPALAYDANVQVAVLFGGGLNAATPQNDTWEYDGTTWTETTSDPRPPPSMYPAMAYDPIHARTILFAADGSTWAYAARQWSRLDLVESPIGRHGASMVFDAIRGRLVLFGGSDRVDSYYADAWELDDASWRLLQPVGAIPPPRQNGALSTLGTSIVLYGGIGSAGTLGDTWTLRYGSTTPDEDCENSTDDDGDRQVDALDPDCVAGVL